MAVRKRPAVAAAAARPRPLRLVSKRIGVDGKGWTWVATWHQNRRPFVYRECLTDVSIEKKKSGKKTCPKHPTVNVGKSGNGRCELKCPRGLPAPWGGDKGQARALWARLVAWLFSEKPARLTLADYFANDPDDPSSYKWVADLIKQQSDSRWNTALIRKRS